MKKVKSNDEIYVPSYDPLGDQIIKIPIKFNKSLNVKEIKTIIIPDKFEKEGDGALAKRYIGNQYLPNLDPFIMFDEYKVKLPAGFPDHPHKGMELVTYMKEGTMLYEDCEGNKGKLEAGDV